MRPATWCLIGLMGVPGAVWGQAVARQDAASASAPAHERTQDIRRGERLAMFGGCHDCHTPKIMTAKGPQLDESRLLSGFPADASLPPTPQDIIGPRQWGAVASNDLTAWVGPWGISYAANLTPDLTGLGPWTSQQFIQAMRTGKHLGIGRPILPPMPWSGLAALTDQDLQALFAYLKSLKPVSNLVPAPVPPQ